MAVAVTFEFAGGLKERMRQAMLAEREALPSAASAAERRSAARAAFLAQVPLFAALAEKERRTLAEACCVRSFKPGEVLFHEGDPGHSLYILQSGRVKIVLVAPDGQETILDVDGPGECVGELSLLDGGPRSATAVALDGVEVVALPREEFLAVLERCPGMAAALMRRLATIIRRVNGQVHDVAWLNIPARLAKTLLELAEEHGEPTPEGIRIDLRLTQQDLAQMVGATRSQVNKCLRAFERRGILTLERERITLRKPHELRKHVS